MQNSIKLRAEPEVAETLVEELARQPGRNYPFRLENFEAGARIQESDPEVQSRMVLAMVRWLEQHGATTYNQTSWKMRQALFVLLKRKLPLSESDILIILDWSAQVGSNYWRGLPQLVKLVSDYLKQNELSTAMAASIGRLIQAVEAERMTVEDQRHILHLHELVGNQAVRLPMTEGDAWADAALADINAFDVEKRNAWARLLLCCLRATGSAPTRKWLKDSQASLDVIGDQDFRSAVLQWFPLADRPRESPGRRDNGQMPLPGNADILKGLAWLCSRFEDTEIARALTALAISAYRRLPGYGPRAAKIGNACFWALGSMPSAEGVAQLSILKVKIKGSSPQKTISAAITMAAKRTGIAMEEMEELCVPTYGFEEVGTQSYMFNDVLARITVIGSDVEQTWERSGKQLSTVPTDVRDRYPAEFKEITQTVKDIRKLLPALRDRMDRLYLSPRKWTLAAWRVRYLEHPMAGTVARRLIWKFSKGDRAESGIWHAGQIVGRDDKPLTWMDDRTNVELWHPISAGPDVVSAWRNWLAAHNVQQPFKQAHREIYILTDAERSTGVYSNRFAAHILRQHQFHALCAVRGWKNSLRLMVDSEFPPATRLLAPWNLRAEFWVEGIGNHYGHDTNETGTFLYLTTDQVRFYHRDAAENRAHASGGGYRARRWNNHDNADPLPLEQIPPLVFSEVMRDVDLFVGVASLGNDPNWLDGGPEVRYRDYWNSYSFGELTESARTRKQVLETLLPRLKIAERCQLDEKFLLVTGDIRKYKIHLGSGNILMEPNDQYLCIVPSRAAGALAREKLLLPFEGDPTLAVILSKAFLLAEDKKITDPTITRQLKR